MRATLLMIPLALSSAACSSQDDFAQGAGVERAEAGAEAEPLEGLSVEEKAEKDGANFEFGYHYPAAVSAEPALAEQLTAEKDKALADEKAAWNAAQAESPPDCTSCRSRGYEKTWKVVADLPDWLSLSADLYSYTGGAHGMNGVQSLVWNKARGEAMDGAALIRSPAVLEQALGTKLCEALNAERVKKGMEPVVAEDGIFPACPGLDEATILVGSSNGNTFDRITVNYGPYVAGSYAEGAYELDFPVDKAVLGAVKSEYGAAFSARR